MALLNCHHFTVNTWWDIFINISLPLLYGDNKEQPAHLYSLISTIIIRSLECLFFGLNALHPSQQLWSCQDGQFT